MAFTVGQCVSGLPAKFNNRTNVGSTADGTIGTVAVTDAIQNLTETFEFEELKYQTPVPPATTLSLTQGNPVVTIASLMATIAANPLYPQFASSTWIDLTNVFSFWMWFSGGVNQAGRVLEYRRIPVVDLYSYGITSNQQGNLGQAPPVYFSRFGTALQVSPVPDQNYQFFVRMQLRHPFPAAAVANQSVFMPDSWKQAVQWLAIYNLSLGEGAVDYANMAAGKLLALGVDVKVLGLKAQMERDEKHNSRAMSLRTASYTFAR